MEIAAEQMPDLILTDLMMPEMDGLELCSTIKNDIRYSHIPIILLTAKASEEHQLEGLSVGADDYITKPFNMEVLKLRINKIIEMNVMSGVRDELGGVVKLRGVEQLLRFGQRGLVEPLHALHNLQAILSLSTRDVKEILIPRVTTGKGSRFELLP